MEKKELKKIAKKIVEAKDYSDDNNYIYNEIVDKMLGVMYESDLADVIKLVSPIDNNLIDDINKDFLNIYDNNDNRNISNIFDTIRTYYYYYLHND